MDPPEVHHGVPEADDVWKCFHCEAVNQVWVRKCPICHHLRDDNLFCEVERDIPYSTVAPDGSTSLQSTSTSAQIPQNEAVSTPTLHDEQTPTEQISKNNRPLRRRPVVVQQVPPPPPKTEVHAEVCTNPDCGMCCRMRDPPEKKTTPVITQKLPPQSPRPAIQGWMNPGDARYLKGSAVVTPATSRRPRSPNFDTRHRIPKRTHNYYKGDGPVYHSENRTRRPNVDSYQVRNKAANRASRIPFGPSQSDSSGDERQSQSTPATRISNGSNEIRLRVDASAPLSLAFNGDMEGRTLQLLPTNSPGMADIVIGSPRGGENSYSREVKDEKVASKRSRRPSTTDPSLPASKDDNRPVNRDRLSRRVSGIPPKVLDHEGDAGSNANSAPAAEPRSLLESPWSAQDDDTLTQARERSFSWNKIASKHFPSKSPDACRHRYAQLMNEDLSSHLMSRSRSATQYSSEEPIASAFPRPPNLYEYEDPFAKQVAYHKLYRQKDYESEDSGESSEEEDTYYTWPIPNAISTQSRMKRIPKSSYKLPNANSPWHYPNPPGSSIIPQAPSDFSSGFDQSKNGNRDSFDLAGASDASISNFAGEDSIKQARFEVKRAEARIKEREEARAKERNVIAKAKQDKLRAKVREDARQQAQKERESLGREQENRELVEAEERQRRSDRKRKGFSASNEETELSAGMDKESMSRFPTLEIGLQRDDLTAVKQRPRHLNSLRPDSYNVDGTNPLVEANETSHTCVVGRPDMPPQAHRPHGTGLKWTPEDDKLLVELKETKNLTWSQISDFFPGQESRTLALHYETILTSKAKNGNENVPEKEPRGAKTTESSASVLNSKPLAGSDVKKRPTPSAFVRWAAGNAPSSTTSPRPDDFVVPLGPEGSNTKHDYLDAFNDFLSGKEPNYSMLKDEINMSGQYRCEDLECDKVYLKLDARLEHYKKDHPHLALGFSTRLRRLSSSMSLGLPSDEDVDSSKNANLDSGHPGRSSAVEAPEGTGLSPNDDSDSQKPSTTKSTGKFVLSQATPPIAEVEPEEYSWDTVESRQPAGSNSVSKNAGKEIKDMPAHVHPEDSREVQDELETGALEEYTAAQERPMSTHPPSQLADPVPPLPPWNDTMERTATQDSIRANIPSWFSDEALRMVEDMVEDPWLDDSGRRNPFLDPPKSTSSMNFVRESLIEEPENNTVYQPDTPTRHMGVVNGGKWGQGLKEMDPEEEAYFNASDNEDENIHNTGKPILNGASPVRILVNYPDDDAAEDQSHVQERWKEASDNDENTGEDISYIEDDVSVVSSYAASVASIFSVDSLASSASDLSKSSGYSTVQILTATKEVLVILHEDLVLRPLFESAIENPKIGPDRLQRNFGRLLKLYAEQLENEAKDRLEYLASRLVRIKATFLAQSIVEKFHSTPRSPAVQVYRSESSDEEDDEEEEENSARPIDEDSFEDLTVLREFLASGEAFKTLRSKLDRFVSSRVPPNIPDEDVMALVDSEPSKRYNSRRRREHGAGISMTRTWSRWLEDAKLTVDGLLRMSDLHLLGQISWHLALDAFCLATDDVLITTGLLEPALDEGKVRLRWQCKCGDSLHSDVVELREDGISELVSHMQRTSGAKVHSAPFSHNSSNQRYVKPRPGQWVQNAVTKVVSAFGKSPGTSSCLPQHNSSCAATACATTTGGNPAQQDILHLLACMHRSGVRKVLQQDRIEGVTTDRTLLCFLRKQFLRHRGRILHKLSLKSVKGIFFVKFRLPIGGSVDVRHHNPCCVANPTAQSPCECIPPLPKVEPSPGAEYRCIPGPPATYPPIPPEYLSSLFTCPSDCHKDDTWILDQLPKRTCGELQGKVGQPAEGWGIYYQEGLDRDMITLLVFLIFMFASLLFGVLWSKYQFDMQAAFGVSAYMVAASTIITTMIATRAEKMG